eukprot:m.126300 g.126300  ORF g.126300 m.126300 type:complete len:240 (-) comp29195_c0_seq10:35-754(-)
MGLTKVRRKQNSVDDGMRIVGLVTSAILCFIFVCMVVLGLIFLRLLGTAGVEAVRYTEYIVAILSGFQATSKFAILESQESGSAKRVFEVLNDFKQNLSAQGKWMSDASITRLLLAGTEDPKISFSVHDALDVVDDHDVLPIRMGGHFWHLVQQGTVHTVVTIVAMRATWVMMHRGLRTRQMIHLKTRPIAVFASWSCIVLSFLILSVAPIAFGGWSAWLAVAGLVLHLDLYHSDAKMR